MRARVESPPKATRTATIGQVKAVFLQRLGDQPDPDTVERALLAARTEAGRQGLLPNVPLRLSVGLSNVIRERGGDLTPGDVDRALREPQGRERDRPVAVRHAGTQLARSGPQGRELHFPDPTPWREAVDGADLLNELADTAQAFVVLPKHGAAAVALWVVHTHAHDAAQVSPLLGLQSPVPQCGKTRTLEFVAGVVPRPLSASNISTAAVFRAVEKYRPTLLVDEADTFLTENQELRGVLNSGHTRANAVVVRTVGQDFEPRAFGTWGPKAIAKIGELPRTLADRAIILRMKRCTPAEEEALDEARTNRSRDLEPLRQRACRWANDSLGALRGANPSMPPGLRGRTADNWRPLLAIADLAGGDWPERARQAALVLSGSAATEDTSDRIQLLTDIYHLFQDSGVERLSSEKLVEMLTGREDRPWSEWRNGRPLTKPQLAGLLRPFGIRPKDIRFDESVKKGYYRRQFEDAWSRYVPPEPQQAEQSSNDGRKAGSKKRNKKKRVADAKSKKRPEKTGNVADVADRRAGRRPTKHIPGSAWNLTRRAAVR